MARRNDRRTTIERHLRHAVHDGRLRLEYQPIISLRTSAVAGAGAPLRGRVGFALLERPP